MTRETNFLHYLILFCAGFTLALPTGAAQGADWPGWRGPQRTGISAEDNWRKNWTEPAVPKVLWKAAIGTGFASMAVAGGRVYSTGNQNEQDTVFCHDAKTGAEIWKYSFAEPLGAKYYEGGTSSTPLVDEGHVYTLSKTGKLYCFDAADGKQPLWVKDLKELLKIRLGDWGLACSPVVLGDKLIMDVGVIAALNKKTGELIWRTKDFAAAYSTPAVFERDGQTLLACFPAAGLVIVNAADGTVLGQLKWKTSYNVNDTTPIIEKDRVHILTGYGKGETLVDISDLANPKSVWEKDTPNKTAQMSTGVLLQGNLYGFKGDTLRCMEFATGKSLWEQKGFGQGSLIMAGGNLIILSDSGELAVAEASPAGYKELARTQVLGGKCWTAPALADGLLYCRNARGELICFDLRP